MREKPRSESHGAKHGPDVEAALRGVTGWVADFGCGEGIFSDISDRYVGLDLDGAWAGRLVGAGKRAVAADVQRAPLRDGSIGGILCMNMLQGVPDPGRVIAEIDRVLRPGGRIYLKNRWHKGGGEPQGMWGRMGRALHLHHLRFWVHPFAHRDGAIAWALNPNGTRAVCPRCVRRFFARRGYAIESLSGQVFILTKPATNQPG